MACEPTLVGYVVRWLCSACRSGTEGSVRVATRSTALPAQATKGCAPRGVSSQRQESRWADLIAIWGRHDWSYTSPQCVDRRAGAEGGATSTAVEVRDCAVQQADQADGPLRHAACLRKLRAGSARSLSPALGGLETHGKTEECDALSSRCCWQCHTRVSWPPGHRPWVRTRSGFTPP